ncbi:MAG TPA: hypothetical protein PLU17_13080 [Chitinophagaceae bacterium]|nr:hypothetical protein [Chitinophagaceae bacterium]
MRKTYLLYLLSFILFIGNLHAQLNNSLLEHPIELNDSSKESVCLSIYSNSFFKNNEYFDDIAKGYTLFGTQLQTELGYIVNPHLRIQAGLYARKDFGNESFTNIAPVFSVKFKKNGYSVIMGTLEGNISHQMAEPIYNYERVILNHLENGLQFKIDKKKIWADTWINWEVQQYLNSTFQEQLSGGHSSKIKLLEHKNFTIQLPLQLLISHKGGQLDLDTSSLKTITNTATGLILNFKSKNPSSFIQSINSENYITSFIDMSPSKTLNFKKGNGLFLNLNAVSKYDIGLSFGFWSGRNYLSSRGGDLFKSEASIYGTNNYTEPKRDLIFARLFYQRKILNALYTDIRFEPFYNLKNNTLQYSYSVYLTYKTDLTLVNLINGKRRNK